MAVQGDTSSEESTSLAGSSGERAGLERQSWMASAFLKVGCESH